jgi:putative ABC transport system ATP-binding protein
MDTPDTGSILIKGEDITHMKDKKLSAFRRRNIGFIYQDYSLFPEFTAYENIVMPILLDKKKADDKKSDKKVVKKSDKKAPNLPNQF